MAEGGAEALQQGCERPHLIASIVKKQRETGAVFHWIDPSTWEIEEGRCRVPGHPLLPSV